MLGWFKDHRLNTQEMTEFKYWDKLLCSIGGSYERVQSADEVRQGYEQISLTAQKANYVVKMYKNVEFKAIDENAEEYTMVCELYEERCLWTGN